MLTSLSVRSALTGLWVLVLGICVGLAFFLAKVYQQSGENQTKSAELLVRQAEDSTFTRYQNYLANSDSEQSSSTSDKAERTRALRLLLSLVLTQFEGIEGGFWTPRDGFVAYSFPTYGGPSIKKDLPSSELDTLRAVNMDVLKINAPQLRHFNRESRSLIVYSRPVRALGTDAALWTMGWASTRNTDLYSQVAIVLGILFLCSLISGIWLTTYLFQWSKKVTELEESISGVSIDNLPQLNLTGQKELDRLVTALNEVNFRLKKAQTSSAQLSKELARADKLNGLGRIVAGFAHEIRNPLATICLSAENALEGATGKHERLVKNILSEAQGLEALLQKLLTVAKLNELKASEINLCTWWQQRLDLFAPLAEKKDISLTGTAPDSVWSFDEESLSRAIGNLLLNAVQNTPTGGWIKTCVQLTETNCRIIIEDSGPGIPDGDRETIFEPLVSGRPDGVGIGLTIVKEVIDAHHGSIECLQGKNGACFELEIPWLRS